MDKTKFDLYGSIFHDNKGKVPSFYRETFSSRECVAILIVNFLWASMDNGNIIQEVKSENSMIPGL